MCDTCSFPVFQNGHCDGDDDDYDDGDDDDTLSARKATGDTDACHLYVSEYDDDEYDDCDDVVEMRYAKPSPWIFRRDPLVKYTGTPHPDIEYTPIARLVGEYLQMTL